MPNVIHFYGERGLVDSLLLDLQAAGKLADLLNGVEFPFRNPTRLGIAADAEIVVVVEAGFGGNRAGFGWPDAILIATLPTGGKVVCFVEAKAGLYADEAADFTDRKKGFNSKINGQLSLRFRLAQALRAYRRGGKRLVEPDDVARAYGEQGRPRRLVKADNLRKVVEPYLLAADENQTVEYLFVALTDDDANVWQGMADDSPRLPFVPNPLAADEDAPEDLWVVSRNTPWADNKKAFGWVGFRAVEDLVKDGPLFARARHFLDAKRAEREGRAAAGAADKARNIGPKEGGRWKKFGPDSPTIRLRDRIRSIIRDAIRGTDLAYDDGPDGSDSVIGVADDRLVKVWPPLDEFREAAVCLGVNTSVSGFPDGVLAGGRKNRPRGVNNVPFQIIGLREGEMPDEELEQFVRDIVARAAADDESDES